jgi:hypothetical protein
MSMLGVWYISVEETTDAHGLPSDGKARRLGFIVKETDRKLRAVRVRVDGRSLVGQVAAD